MKIGIVNMYKTLYGCKYLINAIISLNYTPLVIDGFNHTEEEVYNYIKSSPITHWIFSGSPQYVTHEESSQISLKLLNLKNKRCMMICYSMESILVQLGCSISKRSHNKKEIFRLVVDGKDPLVLRRNHHWYFKPSAIKEPIKLLASYDGEAMIAHYKNAVLIQFHPEKSVDGKKLIEEWIKS